MGKIKLPFACNITTGKLDANSAENNGVYPFFTCGENPERINSYAFDDDVIILAGNNAQGNFHIQRYTGKFNAYQRTYVITAKEGFDIDYIKYSIELSLSHLKKIAQGSQTKFLTMSILNEFEIEDITLEKQKKLVASIVAIDKKIENNNAINNNLLQMIDTIYQEFVFSNRAKKTDFKTQNMFKNELFTLIKPGVSQFDTKTYYATSEVNDMNIGNGWIISYNNRESRANMTPTLYSVWFAKMKNSVKHLFLNNEMSNFIDNSILSTGFYGLQCSEISFEYVASVIHNDNFEKLKDVLAHGATQQGIGDDDLKNIKLLVPSEDLLQEYHNKTAPIFSLISKNINENNSLIRLRDYLLPLLMNGQVVVED